MATQKQKKKKPSLIKTIAQAIPGLCAGIIVGLMWARVIPLTPELQQAFVSLLVMAVIIYAFSRMPVIGWIIGSAHRGFFHNITKAKVERFIWHNALAAFLMVALMRYLAGT